MKFTISKRFSFEAAHSLPHMPEGHKCKRQHGHSYVVEVFCTGPLDWRGFVIDYAEISAAVDPVIARLDHQNLDDILPFHTTAENIGAWILDEVSKTISVARVDVHETAKTVVIVERDKE